MTQQDAQQGDGHPEIEPPPLEDFEPSNDVEEMALALAVAGIIDDDYDGPGVVMDFKRAEMVLEALADRQRSLHSMNHGIADHASCGDWCEVHRLGDRVLEALYEGEALMSLPPITPRPA